MKTVLICVGMILMSVAGIRCALAAPAYGTRMPEPGKMHWGLQTHKVFDRELSGAEGSMDSLQNFVLLPLGLTDGLVLDVKGGIGDVQQQPDIGSELNYSHFLAGGYGFRWRFFQKDATRAVLGFQHISVHPYSMEVNGLKHKAVIDDWQFSLLISHEFSHLTPYIGTKWSRMDYIHWEGTERKRVKSDETRAVGAILGVDIPLMDRFWINLEGPFIDVRAASASVNVAF
jgi:hypothetical protein